MGRSASTVGTCFCTINYMFNQATRGREPLRVVEVAYGVRGLIPKTIFLFYVYYLPRGLQDFVGLERSRHEHQ